MANPKCSSGYITGSYESNKCDLQGDECVGKQFSASKHGVLTITAIVDGKGITDSSGSSRKPSGAAALAFARSNGRLLVVALVAAIGGRADFVTTSLFVSEITRPRKLQQFGTIASLYYGSAYQRNY